MTVRNYLLEKSLFGLLIKNLIKNICLNNIYLKSSRIYE